MCVNVVGMTLQRRAGNTREAILEILRRFDARSVEELGGAQGRARPPRPPPPATVRRHLDVLIRDGYVSVSQVRGRTGRPRYAFSLTEAGADFFGHHYVRITRRLLHEIASMSADDTSGLDGPGLAELVFDRISDRLAGEYAPLVDGATAAERAHDTARLLEEEGFDLEVVEDNGDVHVMCRDCPCKRLRQTADSALFERAHAGGCDHDRRLLEALIGASLEPYEGGELPAEFSCAYVVPGGVSR